MTQPKLVKIDLIGNSKLFTKLLIALSRVTEEDIRSLSVGNPATGAVTMTGEVLSDTMKAVLYICRKTGNVYNEKRSQYELLRPGDKITAPFKELILAEEDYRSMVEIFCLLFKTEYGSNCTYHRQMGFDDKFRIWVGSNTIRDLSDLSTFSDISVISR